MSEQSHLKAVQDNDWRPDTPQSAVSSFNYPLPVDSTLETPVTGAADFPRSDHKFVPARPHPYPSPASDQQDYTFYTHPPTSPSERSSHTDDSNMNSSVDPSLTPYIYDSPSLPQKEPYFGMYGVSAPATNTSAADACPRIMATSSYDHGFTVYPDVRPPNQPVRVEPYFINNPTVRNVRTSKRKLEDHICNGHALFHHSTAGGIPRNADSRAARKRQRNTATNRIEIPPLDQITGIDSKERLLLTLRQGVDGQPAGSWKETAEEWHKETGEIWAEPRLQMSYKRLKERLRVWDVRSNEALTGAMDALAKALFQILADKMAGEYGIDPPWTAIAIKRRLKEMSLAEFSPVFAQLVKRQCDMPDPEEDESETDEESPEVQYATQYSGYAPIPTTSVYSNDNARNGNSTIPTHSNTYPSAHIPNPGLTPDLSPGHPGSASSPYAQFTQCPSNRHMHPASPPVHQDTYPPTHPGTENSQYPQLTRPQSSRSMLPASPPAQQDAYQRMAQVAQQSLHDGLPAQHEYASPGMSSHTAMSPPAPPSRRGSYQSVASVAHQNGNNGEGHEARHAKIEY